MNIKILILYFLFQVNNIYSQDTLYYAKFSYVNDSVVEPSNFYIFYLHSICIFKDKYTVDGIGLFKMYFNNVKYKKNIFTYLSYDSIRIDTLFQFSFNKKDTLQYYDFYEHRYSNYINLYNKYPNSNYKCIYSKKTKIIVDNKKVKCYLFNLKNSNEFYSYRKIYLRKKDLILMRDDKFIQINNDTFILGEQVIASKKRNSISSYNSYFD